MQDLLFQTLSDYNVLILLRYSNRIFIKWLQSWSWYWYLHWQNLLLSIGATLVGIFLYRWNTGCFIYPLPFVVLNRITWGICSMFYLNNSVWHTLLHLLLRCPQGLWAHMLVCDILINSFTVMYSHVKYGTQYTLNFSPQLLLLYFVTSIFPWECVAEMAWLHVVVLLLEFLHLSSWGHCQREEFETFRSLSPCIRNIVSVEVYVSNSFIPFWHYVIVITWKASNCVICYYAHACTRIYVAELHP